MTFDYDGNEYDIKFEHKFVQSSCCEKTVRSTACYISKIDPTIPKGKERYQGSAVGFAIQHVNDKDVKSTARKIALGKAIKLFVERTECGTKYGYRTSAAKIIRKRIWCAYFNQCELKTYISIRRDREYIEKMKVVDTKLLRTDDLFNRYPR